MLRPFHYGPFLRYFLSQSISSVGNRVYALALPFLIFELGGDAGDLGTAFTAFSVPQLLFLLVGGLAVDRLPRRQLMILADLLRLAVLAVVVVRLATGTPTLLEVHLMAGLFGFASAFFQPASFSIVPELLPKEELASGNSLRAFSQEMAGVLGPPIGGVLVASGGVAFALGFDLLTFVVGVALLFTLPGAPPTDPDVHEPFAFRQEFLAGFDYVLGSTWLWLTILIFASVNVFMAGSIAVVLPVVAESSLGGAAALGWLLAAMAGGALGGSLLLGQLGLRRRRGLTAYLGVAVSGFCLLSFALVPTMTVGLTSMFLLGASLILFGVIWESTVQELVPAQMLGRVISIDMLGSFALLPLGYLLLGRAVQAYGPAVVLFTCGTLTVALVLVGLAVPAIRRLD
ncbi:MAG TPA: MFS transporter [Trueperaceae bacterium]